MNDINRINCIVLIGAALFAGSAAAAIDVRSAGMASKGVVTGNYATAPFSNPALLALHHPDTPTLTLPSVSARQDGYMAVVDDVDEASSLLSVRDINLKDQMLVSLEKLKYTQAFGQAEAGLAVTVPSDFNIALFGRAGIKNYVSAEVDERDFDTIRNESVAPFLSTARSVSLQNLEAGFTTAHRFQFRYASLLVGGNVKYVERSVYDYTDYVDAFDVEELLNKSVKVSDKYADVDLGFVYIDKRGARFGLTAENLLAKDWVNKDGDVVYEGKPHIVAATGYSRKNISFSSEIDVLPDEGFVGTKEDEKQWVRGGSEFPGLFGESWRVGLKKNLKGQKETVYTAGLGFMPIPKYVSASISAEYTDGDNFGVGLQLTGWF